MAQSSGECPAILDDQAAAWLPDTDDADQSTFSPPRIPGYRILDEISRGGFGAVYRAVQTSLDRVVALKVIYSRTAEPEDLDRLLMEAQCLARITHPAILSVYDSGRVNGHVYMACEYVEGGTLGDEIRKNGPLSLPRFYEMARALIGGLAAAHQAGILHRDLKLSNILLRRSNEPLICDFGLARVSDAIASDTEGLVVGTPQYMAPEVILGQEGSQASDIYSLCTVFYFMLTGQHLFPHGEKYRLFAAHLKEEPRNPQDLNPAIPSHLSRILLRGLKKSPSARWKSARTMLEHVTMSEVRVVQPSRKIARPQAPAVTPVTTRRKTGTFSHTQARLSRETQRIPLGEPRRLSIAGDISVVTFVAALVLGLIVGLAGLL